MPRTNTLSSIDARQLAEYLNELESREAYSAFQKCCASPAWIELMMSARPFADDESVMATAATAWRSVDDASRLQAFAAHPTIGDPVSLQAKFANTAAWAAEEQARVTQAAGETLTQLARQNAAYLERFGYVFIVCATDKTAVEMLENLESRLPNDPETEFQVAFGEQSKITLLRLQKLTQ